MLKRLLFIVPLAAACTPNPEPAVVRQYAVNMHANLQDIVARAQALQSAIDAFVDSPSAATQDAAKAAWLQSRGVYGEVEIGRFYRGPIDELQGRINEWPVDENFIDYTAGNPTGGIINRTRDIPQIDQQVLSYYDGHAGSGNLALGFHAIEFLLWGQRIDQTKGPGPRPYTDYVDGGTAMNQDRRRTYLKLAAQMLVSDVSNLLDDWDLSDPMSYGSQMVAGPPSEALTNMLRGMSSMAIAELLYERLSDPYITRDQKDEESCFSEDTYHDLVANALGVENVYLGRYHDQKGPGISELVAAVDSDLDARMRQQLQTARAAIEAIPQPFDHAVLGAEDSEPRRKVKAAIDACMPLQGSLAAVAQALGISINLM